MLVDTDIISHPGWYKGDMCGVLYSSRGGGFTYVVCCLDQQTCISTQAGQEDEH